METMMTNFDDNHDADDDGYNDDEVDPRFVSRHAPTWILPGPIHWLVCLSELTFVLSTGRGA